MAVTSGLGRNGPWLQNEWLRVETRTDDGSVSPFSLATGFRPTERAVSSIAPLTGAPLLFTRCDYDMRATGGKLGDGRAIELRSRDRRGVLLRREVALHDDQPYCVTRVGATNESGSPLALSSLHPFTSGAGRGRLQVSGAPADLRVYRHGWQSWSPTMSLSGSAFDLRSAPPTGAPEAPLEDSGRFASDDVGVLHDPAAGRSLLVGAVTALDFITQVFVDAPARSIDVRCHADGIAVQPGETLWSEWVLVDAAGQPHEQLERYGDALGRAMDARVPATTPSGWCSWYYFYTQVSEDDVMRNLRFLEANRDRLPVETVQIDDGYQADIGDWLTVNEKFPHGMEWLASQIRDAGFKPGIWLAPFLLAESSRTFAEHPDWVVRAPDGAPVVAQQNWGRACYGLDGSHPDARAWLTDLFREVGDGWGYDYVKIDFLFGGAIAGRRHDPQATRVRAYRQALDAVREGVRDERFILGCGALMAPSVGIFDGNRIGPDTAPFWRFLTREQRAQPAPPPRGPDDHLSGETSTRNVLNRWWMHGRLWANDPDCLMVRDSRTKLSPAEVETLASAIGLSGGMTLISDDLALVATARVDMASMFLPPLPRSATPIDLTLSDMPERFEYVDDRPFDPVRIVGLFNFSDHPRDLMLELPGGTWQTFDLWSEQYLGERSGEISLEGVAPHGCRVVALRPRIGHPAVIGTNAHIGAGIVDISSAHWNASTSALRVTLEPAGRVRRKIWIAKGGRSAQMATLDGVPLAPAAHGDVIVIEVNVAQTSTLELVLA